MVLALGARLPPSSPTGDQWAGLSASLQPSQPRQGRRRGDGLQVPLLPGPRQRTAPTLTLSAPGSGTERSMVHTMKQSPENYLREFQDEAFCAAV